MAVFLPVVFCSLLILLECCNSNSNSDYTDFCAMSDNQRLLFCVLFVEAISCCLPVIFAVVICTHKMPLARKALLTHSVFMLLSNAASSSWLSLFSPFNQVVHDVARVYVHVYKTLSRFSYKKKILFQFYFIFTIFFVLS